MSRREEVLAIAQNFETTFSAHTIDPRLAYLDDLVRYAYARLGSIEEAEDVAIEVLQAAAQRRGGLTAIREPKIYLLGMARRKVAEHFRRNQRERGHATLALEDLSHLERSPMATEQGVAVREVLAKLPEMYQEVLLLKYVHGLSAEEIAQVIGKSRNATRSLVQRSRDAFAREGSHLVEEA